MTSYVSLVFYQISRSTGQNQIFDSPALKPSRNRSQSTKHIDSALRIGRDMGNSSLATVALGSHFFSDSLQTFKHRPKHYLFEQPFSRQLCYRPAAAIRPLIMSTYAALPAAYYYYYYYYYYYNLFRKRSCITVNRDNNTTHRSIMRLEYSHCNEK